MKTAQTLCILLVLAACGLRATAQYRDSTLVRSGVTGKFINVSRPQDLHTEWWLLMKDGDVVVTDADDILYREGELLVSGTLKDVRIPTADVRGITFLPSRNKFRNTLIGSLYLTSMLLYSPRGTPGFYAGSVEQSRSEIDFPGISVFSVLLSAGTSLTVAAVMNMMESGAESLPLDGTESEKAWHLLLQDSWPRWHIRGTGAVVLSNAASDWKTEHERYSITERSRQSINYGSTRLEMSELNLSRLLRLGYSVHRNFEAGIAWQGEGVQKFYEEFQYIRPGTPPPPVIQELSTKAAVSSFFLTGQYSILPLRAGATALHVGGGVGVSKISVETAGFSYSGYQTAEEEILSSTQLGFLFFASLEYALDNDLSIGVTIDYSSPGKVTIPDQTVNDYDGRTYLDIDEFDLSLSSIGIGFSVGFHF